MYRLRRNRTSGNVIVEPILVIKELNSLKKGLMLDGIKGMVLSEQDPI